MGYLIIAIFIVVTVVAGVALYLRKDRKGHMGVITSTSPKEKANNAPVIHMELLPADESPEETQLVEITDRKVLAHINNLVPGLAQAGNAVNNVAQAVNAFSWLRSCKRGLPPVTYHSLYQDA